MDEHIKSFVIGSSYLVFVHYFLAVQKIHPELMNYTFRQYSLAAPVYLGFMNLLGGIFFGNLGPMRYFLTGLISGCFIAMIVKDLKSYNYSENKWRSYYVHIIMKHIFTFFIVIQGLTRLIN